MQGLVVSMRSETSQLTWSSCVYVRSTQRLLEEYTKVIILLGCCLTSLVVEESFDRGIGRERLAGWRSSIVLYRRQYRPNHRVELPCCNHFFGLLSEIVCRIGNSSAAIPSCGRPAEYDGLFSPCVATENQALFGT